jgi:hypothetical protein
VTRFFRPVESVIRLVFMSLWAEKNSVRWKGYPSQHHCLW